jgi:diguanylate cyclase (GGDEF)-like protein
MTIRKKIFLSVLILSSILTAAIALFLNYYLTQRFINLETDYAHANMSRVDNALNQQMDNLLNLANAWADRDDTYNYLTTLDPKFISANFNPLVFKNININLVELWSSDKKPLVMRLYNTDYNKELPPSTMLNNFIKQYLFSNDAHKLTNFKRTIVPTEYGLMVIAISTITNSNMAATPDGIIVMGRLIDEDFINRLKLATDLNVNLLSLNILPAALKNALLHKLAANYNILIARNEDSISSYSVLFTHTNPPAPIGIMEVSGTRNAYHLGKMAVNIAWLSFVTLSLLFIVLIYFILNIIVIKRLERLKNELKSITENHALDKQVSVARNDEITYVARQINKILLTINKSKDLLERRVTERTTTLNDTSKKLSQEITQRKKVEAELRAHKEHLHHLAHHDTLTGLPNRVLFNEELNKALKIAAEKNTLLALLFIDLDRFKTINNTKGHQAGDLVLKTIATRLSSLSLPEESIVARLGGDEFIVLIKSLKTKEQIAEISKAILATCATPIQDQLNTYYLSASVGVSIYPQDGHTLEELQKKADIAMYKSKSTAPGNFLYYDQNMYFAAEDKTLLAEQLHLALEHKEFFLHFQPQIAMKNSSLVSIEALLRWNSPHLGEVNPSDFIPFAERSGPIIPITNWVIDEAFKTLKEWQEQKAINVKMSVNISAVQFAQHNFITSLLQALNKYYLDPQKIIIELTESTVINDLKNGTQKLNQLKKYGFKVAIDDFGSGYTSLNYIKSFPIDYLNIDKSYINGINKNQANMTIIETLIKLSHELDIQVVAEGIETAEQFDYLASLDCDIAQGYFLAKPMSKDNILAELIKAKSALADQPK